MTARVGLSGPERSDEEDEWQRTFSVDGALIHFLEGVGCRQYLYLIEGLSTVQAFPVMDGPGLEIHLQAVIIFLKQVGPPAKGAHDRFHESSPPIFPPETSDRDRIFFPAL
jgi:hypothetical protein